MECASCKAVVPEGSKFCTECGAPMSVACPSCRHINPAGSKYCGKCGSQLNADAIQLAETPSTIAQTTRPSESAAERRQVTVMFCDIVGATAVAARFVPEDLR